MRGPEKKKKDGDDLANCVFLSVRTVVVKKNRNNAMLFNARVPLLK